MLDCGSPWGQEPNRVGEYGTIQSPRTAATNPTAKQVEQAPSLITMGSESLQQLVAHMDVNRPAKAGVYAAKTCMTPTVDMIRYRCRLHIHYLDPVPE